MPNPNRTINNILFVIFLCISPMSANAANSVEYRAESIVMVTLNEFGDIAYRRGEENVVITDPAFQNVRHTLSYNDNVIEFRGTKYYRRNLSSFDAMIALGLTNSNETSPMSYSEYVNKTYNFSSIINEKIYVALDYPHVTQAWIIPFGERIIRVAYIDISVNVFQIGIFKSNPPYTIASRTTVLPKDGLVFTEEEVGRDNGTTENAGLVFTVEEVTNFAAEDDELKLALCAAERSECSLIATPQTVREFTKLSKEEAAARVEELLKAKAAN